MRTWIPWIAPIAFLGMAVVVSAKPAYHLMRRSWLLWRAETIWANRETGQTRYGEPVAWLNAPGAGIDSPILLGATQENLAKFPCLSRAGALPGEKGTMILQGHRDTHFRGLGGLEIGDRIFLERDEDYVDCYRVIDIETLPAEQLPRRLSETGFSDRMVLVTCYPFRYIGPAPYRYLVWLQKTEKNAIR